jgi:hypothetical protein
MSKSREDGYTFLGKNRRARHRKNNRANSETDGRTTCSRTCQKCFESYKSNLLHIVAIGLTAIHIGMTQLHRRSPSDHERRIFFMQVVLLSALR